MNAYLELTRPKQWLKSSFVFAPLVFSFEFFNFDSVKNSFIAAFLFIITAAAVYIFNDIIDISEDRKHPQKKKRPLASNRVNPRSATILMILLLITGYLLSTFLDEKCQIIIMCYLVLNILYTKFLKKFAILDVLIIATGFVFRVLIGAFAIDVDVSIWIILSTFMLAIFLGFGKRRYELSIVSNSKTRVSLSRYNEAMLDKMINVSCAASLMTYVMYTAEIAQKAGKDIIIYTVFFVIFGLFRYLQVIYVDKEGGEPEKILIKDKLFILNLLLWLLTTVLILYF